MKNNKTINCRYFKTADLYLASFLFCSGMEISGIDTLDGKNRSKFTFIDAPNREILVNAFLYGKENDGAVLVDARKILFAQKQIKDKLYAM